LIEFVALHLGVFICLFSYIFAIVRGSLDIFFKCYFTKNVFSKLITEKEDEARRRQCKVKKRVDKKYAKAQFKTLHFSRRKA
jgi:hypothetical protein